MAKLIVFVKIFGVGTGDDVNIGMVDGDLQWCSVSGFSGFYNGFVDHNLLDLPGQAINISAGGGMGGFDGKAELKAVDSLVHAAVYSGAISIIGKQIAVFVGVDPATFADANVKFTGKVSTQGFPDEISVSMVCDPSMDFDSKKVPEIVVTQEMALNYEESGAIGKSILPTYGNIVNFPMIFCDPASGIRAHMNGPQNGPDFPEFFRSDAPAYLNEASLVYENMNAALDAFRGKYLLQVVGLWQSSETENVWCALSANGKILWAGETGSFVETYVDRVRASLIGQRLLVTGGTGSGSSFLIVDVEWNTHTTSWGNRSVETLWININTNSISSLKSSLPWTDIPLSETPIGNADCRYKSPFLIPTNYSNTDYLVAAYDSSGEFLSNVSIVAFMAFSNIFIVSSDALIGEGVVVSVVDGKQIEVNADVNQIANLPGWKMIRLGIENSDDGNSSIIQKNYKRKDTYIFADDYENWNQIENRATDIYYDGNAEKYLIPELGIPILHVLPPTGYEQTTPVFKNAFFINMRDFFEGFDLSKANFDFSIIPELTYRMSYNVIGSAGTFKVKLSIDADVISDGNISIGKVSSDCDIVFSETLTTGSSSISLYLNPQNRSVDFSSNCTSHETQSKSLFAAIEKSLDLKSIASMCASIKNANGILIRVNMFISPAYVLYNSVIYYKNLLPCQIAYSREIDKEKLFYRCVLDNTVTSPAGIIKSIADSNGLSTDSATFTTAIAAQREFFSGLPATFDGQYQPASGKSISDVLQSIAEQSMTAVFVDAAGNIQAKFLPEEPESYTFEFNGTNVIRDGLSFSQPKSGYVYSDFSFSTVSNPFEAATAIGIDTDGVTSFPAENDYDIGTIVFAASTGWTIKIEYVGEVSGGGSGYCTLIVQGPSRELLYMFVEGTIWNFKNVTLGSSLTIRIDSVANDMLCPLGKYGVSIGAYISSYVPEFGITENSLRTYGPRAKWRDIVSGVSVENYAIAASMWQMAYAARATLGKEQQAPTSSTKLEQPVWGSEPMAISKWAQSVVSYCTKNKIVIQFDAPYTAEVQAVNFMDWVRFAWGPYSASPISGYVVEVKPNLPSKTISFTLLCYGEYVALPAIITELGELFQLETNEIIAPEIGDTSKKIGALALIDTATAKAAGADLLFTVPGTGNYRGDINEFIASIHSTGVMEIIAGVAGQTSFSVDNPLGSDNLICTVYNTVSGNTIGLALTITDSTISASDLATIEVNGQFRIMARL